MCFIAVVTILQSCLFYQLALVLLLQTDLYSALQYTGRMGGQDAALLAFIGSGYSMCFEEKMFSKKSSSFFCFCFKMDTMAITQFD